MEEPPKSDEHPKVSKRRQVLRGITAFLIVFAILGNTLTVIIPSDTSWTYKTEYVRSGKLYTYLYYYDEILGDPNRDAWLQDISSTFDFVYVIAPWGYYFTDNQTLDEAGLTNTTQMIRELGRRGCQTVIHTWYSSYHPAWLEDYVPELKGTDVRWKGMALDNLHYDILMNTNLQYLRLLSNYLIRENVSDYLYGFCLDDETSSGNWAKVCLESTKLLHTFNASWQITAMFNNERQYWMAGYMDYLAMDPYDDDQGVVSKMKYGQSLNVGKLSVLLNGMSPDNEANGNRMRRQGWIAYFMGADSIGWWCYNIYWHGKRGGVDNDWFFMPYNATGPGFSFKDQGVQGFRLDMTLIKQVEAKRNDAMNASNTDLVKNIDTHYYAAYEAAKIDDFARATLQLQEALLE
jgi:hypothetical protein